MAISFKLSEVMRQDPKTLWSKSENDKHYNFQKQKSMKLIFWTRKIRIWQHFQIFYVNLKP